MSMVSAVMTMAVTIAMTVTVAALGECRAWHREAGRDDQSCDERKLLHSKSLLLGKNLSIC